MSFTGSIYPQRIVYRISALVRRCIEGLAHPISGNFVAPLLLFSVVSHCALLLRRSCWSPDCRLLSDSAEPSLLLVRRLGVIFGFPSPSRQWPTLLYFSLVVRPHCLTEVGLSALLSRLP